MVQPIIRPESTAGRHFLIRPRDTFTAEIEVVQVVYELLRLRRAHANGNGYREAVPNTDAIKHAIAWVKAMHDDVLAVGGEWFKPHVATDEDGDVAFEWSRGNKRLTVYVSPETAEYIKVERPAASSDLIDGVIETSEDRAALWRWLTS